MPTKIAFLLSDFSQGGGERVMLDVATYFAAAGESVDILVVRANAPTPKNLPQSIRVRDFRAGRFLAALPRLIRYIRSERPHTVCATNEHTHILLLLARLISRSKTRIVLRIGIPFSVNFALHRSWRDRFIIQGLARMLYRRADAIVAVSHGVADDLARTVGVQRDTIVVIPHPKDVTSLRSRRATTAPSHPWLREKNIPTIVAVGRLRRQKGFDVLIDALATMRTKTRLVIFGDGYEREALLEQAKSRGVEERVSLPGFTDGMYADIAAADVFVLPSRWEGLPGALVEALVLGVPSVAADCPYGPRELLAPESRATLTTGEVERAPYGLLVAAGDSVGLAKALDLLLESPTIATEYREKALLRGNDFAIEKVMPHYKAVLLPPV